MSRIEDLPVRDALISEQPILWARAMLEAAESARVPEARDAILARVGAVFFARFSVAIYSDELDSARGYLSAREQDSQSPEFAS